VRSGQGAGDAIRAERQSMAVIIAKEIPEKQPHDENGGIREHQTVRRSGPVTGVSMVWRQIMSIAINSSISSSSSSSVLARVLSFLG